MSTQLDLQEQEQLDALKAFWAQYGNLVTWTLVIVLAAYAGWNGWNYWQGKQALQASAMYDALDQAAQAGDADKAARVFSDLKQRFPRTTFAEQGALAAAKVAFDKGRLDAAKAALTWAADNAGEDEYRTIARLRLAAVLAGGKQYDEALKQLDAAKSPTFAALVADRRGDVLAAAGRSNDAKVAYAAAYKAMDPAQEYRRLIEAKLMALGAAPAALAASAAASGAAQ
jgi:predicted negative regulator of RcsB-dependent stress response